MTSNIRDNRTLVPDFLSTTVSEPSHVSIGKRFIFMVEVDLTIFLVEVELTIEAAIREYLGAGADDADRRPSVQLVCLARPPFNRRLLYL